MICHGFLFHDLFLESNAISLFSLGCCELIVPGVAQEGGGGGYHFASSAGLPKLDSTLEILFVTACASQSAQTAQSEGDLLLVCRQKGTSPSSAGRRGGGSLVCYPTLGVRQTRQSDSHFRLVLGLPYTITINIPWRNVETGEFILEKC